MPDQSAAAETSSPNKPEFPRFKNLKDWVTAAIGIIATAVIPSVVIKGLVVAGSPFLADGIVESVKWGAAEFKAYRKHNEPLRLAKGYRKTITKGLRKAAPNSAEKLQLETDLTEMNRVIHELMMQRIRFSVSTSLPTPPTSPTLPPPSTPPALPPSIL